MKITKIFTFTLLATLAGCSDKEPDTKETHIFTKAAKPASNFTNLENTNVGDYLGLNTPDSMNHEDYTNAIEGFINRKTPLVICKNDDNGNAVDTCPLKKNKAWDLTKYTDMLVTIAQDGKYTYQDAPSSSSSEGQTVNPSLWRNAQLNINNGLYQVYRKSGTTVSTAKPDVGDIFQVRGYDLSNITFIKGNKGWIVLDPLISQETTREAQAFINEELDLVDQEGLVSAVIYSHSHIDHYGGVRGLSLLNNGENPADGSSEIDCNTSFCIYAPEHFTEHAVSENVIAGNAMGRRAVYMYGSLLERNVQGSVNSGLGMTTSAGLPSLMLPHVSISNSNEYSPIKPCIDEPCTHINWDIDGVKAQFQLTPGTEAPAEMNTWFSDQKALWMAENTTNTMHNILTLRGAKVRDALLWAKYLNETITLYGKQANVKFQSHHWPVWQRDNSGSIVKDVSLSATNTDNEILEYFNKQRDVYKYMHDQTVRLMNKGYNGEEISEMMELPESLDKNFPTRGYYGTLRHNTRAIYQYYMGWYNAHPSDLNNLTDLQASIRFVDSMGGAKSARTLAATAHDKGDYRWVAEIMKHVVFAKTASELGYGHVGDEELYKYDANSEITDLALFHTEAKLLLADTLEQLGYQAESGPWRSVYLQGADELRNGKGSGALATASPDVISEMTIDMLFDYAAIKLDPGLADTKSIVFNVQFKKDGTIIPDNVTSGEDITCSFAGEEVTPCNFTVSIENSVLNYSKALSGVTETVSISKEDFTIALQLETYQSGITVAETTSGTFTSFLGLLDIPENAEAAKGEFWFNIIEPNIPMDIIPGN